RHPYQGLRLQGSCPSRVERRSPIRDQERQDRSHRGPQGPRPRARTTYRKAVTLPFFTIGHSNRSLEAFIELLKGVHIDLVADIRTIPRSRTNPQFNKTALPDALAAFDVSYAHMAALGGLRGKTRTSPQDVNGFWTNES